MRSIRRGDVEWSPLPGRAVQRIIGKGAAMTSGRMTVGAARYDDSYGPMEPHIHAEESILVLEAERAWVRWGPGKEDLPEVIHLEPGLVLSIPEWEWHVFEWEPGGGAEVIVIYGQVDDIRPEDVGRA